MPSNYRTPGVYVEEITKFPPSVAAVETAIPAFIGYTEIAREKVDRDLVGKAKRITAIAEYTSYYGLPQAEQNFRAEITDTQDNATGNIIRTVRVPEPDPADKSPFMMAYALQMYFANGGGPCYIISVGTYEDAPISADALGNNTEGNGGLDILQKEDEPTIINFPDAQSLNDGDFYTLYQSALAQCNTLKDRVLVMDTKGTQTTAPALFRNGIGTNNLKYGAVYYPFLDTTLGYRYEEDQVDIVHELSDQFDLIQPAIDAISVGATDAITAARAAINALDVPTRVAAILAAADADGQPKTDALDVQIDDADVVNILNAQLVAALDALEDIVVNATAFNDDFEDEDVQDILDILNLSILTDAQAALDETDAGSIAGQIRTFLDAPDASLNDPAAIDSAAEGLQNVVNSILPVIDPAQLSALTNAINANSPSNAASAIQIQVTAIENARTSIIDIDGTDEANAADVATQIQNAISALQSTTDIVDEVLEIPGFNLDIPDVNGIIESLQSAHAVFDDTPDQETYQTAYAALTTSMEEVLTTIVNIQNDIAYLNLGGRTLEEIESIDNATYNLIKQEIDLIGVKLPPSSTMAGVYAQVDRDRGVWKSPANVSLTAVSRPMEKITNLFQDTLNIDPVAGKSINAIRTFAGKGTLVWGARTLAGNDNEWRYISVRRFFNFVEESVKKATEQFVFEPNDANTWTRVRAMIENFLIIQWRDGALQGAKPDQAFYVRVGLGETMTAQDILEGRMIVEIGMAVVRPAEFIILRFSHKLPEA